MGGMMLLHAAMKNHDWVSVLCSPTDYAVFLATWCQGMGDIGPTMRMVLALKAFEVMATYDGVISSYFRQKFASAHLGECVPRPVQCLPLQYGNNPHQKLAQAYVTHQELLYKGMTPTHTPTMLCCVMLMLVFFCVSDSPIFR